MLSSVDRKTDADVATGSEDAAAVEDDAGSVPAPCAVEDAARKCSVSSGGVAPVPGCTVADVPAGGVSPVLDCVDDSTATWLRV